MKAREQAVRARAGEVIDELGVAGFPVDPVAVARQKGLRCETRPGFPAGVYGALYFDGSVFGIVISSQCHGEGHRNFTLGHELGHFHVEGHAESMFSGRPGQVLSQGGHFRDRNSAHEREADWFASELLMPGRWARPRTRELLPTIESLTALAGEFGVSLCCAAVRYAELTDEAVAVVVSHERQIEWVAFSSRFREHAWCRAAWKKQFVPRKTATTRLALSSGRVLAGARDADAGLLCEWFPRAPEMVLADEEAMGLGSYGRVITVLSAPKLPMPEELEEERQEHNWRERDWRDAIRGYRLD